MGRNTIRLKMVGSLAKLVGVGFIYLARNNFTTRILTRMQYTVALDVEEVVIEFEITLSQSCRQIELGMLSQHLYYK